MGSLLSTIADSAGGRQSWYLANPDPEKMSARRRDIMAFIAEHVPAPDVHVHGADEDAIVFCRTVGPRQQAAVAAWAELATADHSDAAATAPGLPVMVAAMLRRPVLEAYLERAAVLAPQQPFLLCDQVAWTPTLSTYNRLAADAGFAAAELTALIERAQQPACRPNGFAPMFNVLTILAAHGDLADALLAVPLHPIPNAGEGELPAGAVVLSAAADAIRQQRVWNRSFAFRPHTVSKLVDVLLMRNDVAALGVLLLTEERVQCWCKSAWGAELDLQPLMHVAGANDPSRKQAAVDAWRSLCRADGALDRTSEPVEISNRLGAALRAIGKAPTAPPPFAAAGDAHALMYHLASRAGAIPEQWTPAMYAALIGRAASAAVGPAAFNEAGAPDVAAALIASAAAAHCSVELAKCVRALAAFELQRNVTRHTSAEVVSVEVRPLAPNRELVVPLFAADSGGAPVLRSCGADAIAVFGPDAHVLLAAARTAPPAGAPATTDRAECARRWAAVSGGVLDGWAFWEHTLVVGGAVAACLDPLRPLPEGSAHDAATAATATACAAAATPEHPGDIDVVFHSVTASGAAVLCAQLQEHAHRVAAARGLRGKSTPDGVAVLLTSRTMTIVFDAPELPRVQVALGHWVSAVDALQTADVDACCCGLTFQAAAATALPNAAGNASATPLPTVLATGRGALAWACKANVPSPRAHAVRGSPAYELRLWKYARRHGFAVLDATTTEPSAAAALHETARLKADPLTDAIDTAAAGRRRRARAAATSVSGLAWLVHVDEGVFTPTPARDDVSVTADRPLAAVIAAVTEAGYVESDNYGTHEEGYALVVGDAAPDPDEIAFDGSRHCIAAGAKLSASAAYLDDATVLRSDFLDSVAIGDQDKIEVGALVKYASRWDADRTPISSDGEEA